MALGDLPTPTRAAGAGPASAKQQAPAAGGTRQFALFVMTGGFAALVNVVSRYLLTPSLGFETAVVVAYLIGMVVAYTLFRALVFGASGRSVGSEATRFTAVNAVALILVWVISVGLARLVFPAVGLLWHSEDIAHLIGVAAPMITSYLGHRYFTFSGER